MNSSKDKKYKFKKIGHAFFYKKYSNSDDYKYFISTFRLTADSALPNFEITVDSTETKDKIAIHELYRRVR